MSRPLNSREVLKELGLAKEIAPGKWSGNINIVTWLVQAGLLPRIPVGPRTFRYDIEDVHDLLKRSKTQGLNLIQRPNK